MIDEQGADRTRSEFAKIAHSATLNPSQRRLDDGWRAMRQRLHAKGWFATSRASEMPVRRWLWAVPVAAALLCVVWFLAPLRSSSEVLTYGVSGGAVVREGWVQAAEQSGVVQFSDGTRVQLAAHSAASVAKLTSFGASIRLQRGQAEFDVHHRANARWTIDAGPFVVHVTGTSFKVRWDEARGHFQIQMRSGSVNVDGPTLPGQRALRGGEALDIVLRPEAADPKPQPAVPAAPDEEQQATAQEAVAAPRDPTSPPSAAPAGGSWTELLARGKVKDVIAQAEAGGINQALSSRGAADLTALADAARYTRQNDLARRALIAVRSRFTGSGQSRDAAFFLGRLEESGAPARALEWYERYLMEAPSGTYAAEAMGRKMLVVERVRGRQAALPLARDYLSRFPEGSYASMARSLLGSR